jgi:hypothetical protein
MTGGLELIKLAIKSICLRAVLKGVSGVLG